MNLEQRNEQPQYRRGWQCPVCLKIHTNKDAAKNCRDSHFIDIDEMPLCRFGPGGNYITDWPMRGGDEL